jgi:hypothetical protein
MNPKHLLLATVVVGVAMNVLDWIVHGTILQGAYYSQLTNLFRQDAPIEWRIIGNFVGALVFVWVYDRVYNCFRGSPEGGAKFGFFAGILMNLPTWLSLSTMLVGFPSGLAWTWTIWGIIQSILLGAVAGATYKKEGVVPAA